MNICLQAKVAMRTFCDKLLFVSVNLEYRVPNVTLEITYYGKKNRRMTSFSSIRLKSLQKPNSDEHLEHRENSAFHWNDSFVMKTKYIHV